MKLKLKCDSCNVLIKKYPCRIRKKNFCSNKCRGDYLSIAMLKEKTKVPCQSCGKIQEKTLNKFDKSKTKRFFCSQSCFGKWQSAELKRKYESGVFNSTTIIKKARLVRGLNAAKRFKEKPATWINKNGYLKISVPGVGQQYYHRYIWEKANGIIPIGHVIHHIDGNPLNNNLINLKCMKSKEHHTHHNKQRARNSSGCFQKNKIEVSNG